MKKLVFIFTLSCSLNAFPSEWTKVSTDIEQVNYINNNSIKKKNRNITFVRLADFSKANKRGRLSALISMKADCEKKNIMYISYETFELNMAEGEKIASHKLPDPKWVYAEPKTYKSKLLKHVCNFFN